MKIFEIYDKIINGELRPDKFNSDGVLLEKKISQLDISKEEYFNYVNYLDKQGIRYTLTISEGDSDKIVINQERNIEYSELIDLDIPPKPDNKGEKYLDLIEFEYSRGMIINEEIIETKTKKEIEESGIKNILKVKKLWKELKHYQKLITGGKALDYQKSNDFVIIILETYLERTAILLIQTLKPFIEENNIQEFYEYIFGERDKLFSEMDKKFERVKLRKKMNIDKKFDDIFEELTKANTIEEKIYNEIDFWKNHSFEKIEGIPQDQLDFISKSMVEQFESELNKARVTGWIRGNKIELEKAERLHNYMKEILTEYDFGKAIGDEIKFVNAMSAINEERNMDDFKPLWEELIEGNFDLKVLLRQFEQIGEDKEDEYIEYCVRRYRHRTKDEWMRYFGALKMADSIDSLNKQNLPADLEYTNSIRIANARFEDGVLGQWTRENLESFEKKYIDTHSKKYTELSELSNEKPLIKNEIKKIEIKETKKEKWLGTKSEFARKVEEEYKLDKGKNYKSLKNACEKIFPKYEFDDKKFTAQRCYDLARKV